MVVDLKHADAACMAVADSLLRFAFDRVQFEILDALPTNAVPQERLLRSLTCLHDPLTVSCTILILLIPFFSFITTAVDAPTRIYDLPGHSWIAQADPAEDQRGQNEQHP